MKTNPLQPNTARPVTQEPYRSGQTGRSVSYALPALCLASVIAACGAFGDAEGEVVLDERDDGAREQALTVSPNTIILNRVHVEAFDDGTTPDATPTWLWDSGPAGIGRYKLRLDGGPDFFYVHETTFTPSMELLRNETHRLEVWSLNRDGTETFIGSRQVKVTAACTLTDAMIDRLGTDETAVRSVSLCATPAYAAQLARRLYSAGSLTDWGRLVRDRRIAGLLVDLYSDNVTYYESFRTDAAVRLQVESEVGAVLDSLFASYDRNVGASGTITCFKFDRALSQAIGLFARSRYVGRIRISPSLTEARDVVARTKLADRLRNGDREDDLSELILRTAAARGLELMGTDAAYNEIQSCENSNACVEAVSCRGAATCPTNYNDYNLQRNLEQIRLRRDKGTTQPAEIVEVPRLLWRRLALHYKGMQFHLYLPPERRGGVLGAPHANYKLAVAVHGTSGESAEAGITMVASRLANAFDRDYLADEGIVVIAPQFDWATFPSYDTLQAFQPGEIRSDRWLLEAIDHSAWLLDELYGRALNKDQFYLYGHSKGGQFVNHFMAVHPDRIVRAVAAGSGFYAHDEGTVPSFHPDLYARAEADGSWNLRRVALSRYAVVIGDQDDAGADLVPDRRIRQAWKYTCTDMWRTCGSASGVTEAECQANVWSQVARLIVWDGTAWQNVANPAAAERPVEAFSTSCGFRLRFIAGGGHNGETNYYGTDALPDVNSASEFLFGN